MKIIEVVTKRGDTLFGCLYGEQYKDTCVIITNGMGGNIFENKFLRVLGEELEKNTISFVYAHNSGAFHRIDTPTKSGNPVGCTYELFDNCLEDLLAYVDWAREYGYKNIILGGHSYGANKVLYYLSLNQKQDIKKYILISPTDTGYFNKEEKLSANKILPYALKLKEEGKIDEIIPIPFDNYNYYTVRAFLDFMENKNSKNLPIYSQNGNWNQLESINKIGLFIMGSEDSFAFGNTLKHLQIINRHSSNKKNIVKVIENGSHNFKGKEIELAQEILKFIK